jgi:hypothetical protein
MFVQLLLLPAIGHGAQERHQRRRRGEHDPLRKPVFDQGLILLQCRPEKLLPRQKQDDEFRRLPELRPVGLETERIHPGSHLTGMAEQMRLTLLVILRLIGIEVGG